MIFNKVVDEGLDNKLLINYNRLSVGSFRFRKKPLLSRVNKCKNNCELNDEDKLTPDETNNTFNRFF